MIQAQFQEFDYAGSELQHKQDELKKWVVKVKAKQILDKKSEVPKFKPKSSTKYSVRKMFKRIVRGLIFKRTSH